MIKKHKKASDIFDESTLFLGQKGTFSEAFPEIEEIIVKCEEIEFIGGNKSWKHVFTKEKLPGEYINCNNRWCHGGGFSIGEKIRAMVDKKEIQISGAECCQGNEGTPNGRKIYHSCPHHFNYTISIKYKG